MSEETPAPPASRSRRRRLRVLLALGPALGFVVLLWIGLSHSGTHATVGRPAPDFELPKLVGSGSLSSAELRGHPVVVNFWASWCAPCRQEAPLLERAWRRYRTDGVIFLGVSIKDARSDALKFERDFGITYPTVVDDSLKLVSAFGLTGVPETYFIDSNWNFIAASAGPQQSSSQGTVVLGPISSEDLQANVEILIRRAASR